MSQNYISFFGDVGAQFFDKSSIYQQKNTYAVLAATPIFSTAPLTVSTIKVTHF